MPLDLFDSIMKEINKDNPQITHILSYDLHNTFASRYTAVEDVIKSIDPNAIKVLNTFWKVSTGNTCQNISARIEVAGGPGTEVCVYQVNIISEKEILKHTPHRILKKELQ